MSVLVSTTNKPLNPRAQDLSPKGYNRAALYSGKALDFDGVNDQITLGTISDLTFGTGDFSAVLYWQIDSVSTYSWAIAKNPSTDFGIGINNTGGLLRLWIGGTLSLGTENILGGDWKKIAVVRESGVVSAYINGVAISLTETAMAGSIDSGDLLVGSWINNDDFWNGLLNNIRIFNTALTPAQISDLYLNPEKIVPDGVADSALKLWLPMMEGAGTTAYDGSGNGNHGTINGATWVSGIGAPVSQTALVSWNKGTNLALASEQFDNAYWSKVGTLTANAGTSPDGYLSADKLAAGTSNYITRQFTTTIGTTYTSSVYIKSANAGQSASLRFNLSAPQPTPSVSTLVSTTDQWQRVTATFTATNTSTFFQIGEWALLGYGPTNDILVWGASLTQSSSVQPYIPTGATAQTSPVLLPQGLTANKDITGVNAFESARNPYALNLDGDSWAEVHDNASLDMTTTATMEAWVNCDNLISSYQIIMVKSSATSWTGNFGRYVLRARQDTLNWWFDDFTANAKYYSVNLSGYNHLVVTKDGTTEKLYINGALVDTETGAATFTASPYSLVIGAQTSYGENWDNQLALPRIYNRALTATEVARNYNADKSKFGL